MALGGEGDREGVIEGAARAAEARRGRSINLFRLYQDFEAAEGVGVYEVAEGHEVGVVLGSGQALISESVLDCHDAQVAKEVSLSDQFFGL